MFNQNKPRICSEVAGLAMLFSHVQQELKRAIEHMLHSKRAKVLFAHPIRKPSDSTHFSGCSWGLDGSSANLLWWVLRLSWDLRTFACWDPSRSWWVVLISFWIWIILRTLRSELHDVTERIVKRSDAKGHLWNPVKHLGGDSKDLKGLTGNSQCLIGRKQAEEISHGRPWSL